MNETINTLRAHIRDLRERLDLLEMTDDYCYTNGKRDRLLAEIHLAEATLKYLQD